MWGCFTSNIIAHYALGQDYKFMDTPHLRSDFADAFFSLLDTVHYVTQFIWMHSIMMSLPQWFVEILSPSIIPYNRFDNVSFHMTFEMLSSWWADKMN